MQAHGPRNFLATDASALSCSPTGSIDRGSGSVCEADRRLRDDVRGHCPKLPVEGYMPPNSTQSKIRHEAHEPLVLVILVVAVEQRRSRIVGDEVDLDRAEPRHVDSIFHHPGCGLVADLGELERVAMQMDGMIVAALVAHREAVALSALRSEQWIGSGPGLTVDGPAIVAAAAARYFLEDKFETFVGRG
jgi:hypothetical protein